MTTKVMFQGNLITLTELLDALKKLFREHIGEEECCTGIPPSWGDEEIEEFCRNFANRKYKLKDMES